MTIIRRFSPLAMAAVALEKRADGKGERIAGYAAVFFREGQAGTEYELWPGYVERVMPGAFDAALKEEHDCRALFNHDPSQLLGRTASETCRLSVDSKGLRYEVDPPDTTVGHNVLEYLRRRDVTGSSFGFEVIDGDMRRETREGQDVWIREVRSVRLWDVGPVTYPAYTATEAEVRDIRAQIEQRARGAVPAAAPAVLGLGGDLVRARARVVEIESLGG